MRWAGTRRSTAGACRSSSCAAAGAIAGTPTPQAQGQILKEILDQRPAIIRHRIGLGLRTAGVKGRIPPVEFVDHHLAHAASVHYASGWEQAAILVMDGSGEERSTTLYHGEGLDIHERGHVDMPDSLGWLGGNHGLPD